MGFDGAHAVLHMRNELGEGDGDIGGGPGLPACHVPSDAYLLGIALRSFFVVLGTHLLAGGVDTTLASAPLCTRLSWLCRYYNPVNLSWRYYSILAYRCIAPAWGTKQLAIVNHDPHPFQPALPFLLADRPCHTFHVRRLELAGPFSAQSILTLSSAYQGFLATQYAISTVGIPYLPNMTVPLAIMGLVRLFVAKWIANKIQVDAHHSPASPPANPELPPEFSVQSRPPDAAADHSHPGNTGAESAGACSPQRRSSPHDLPELAPPDALPLTSPPACSCHSTLDAPGPNKVVLAVWCCFLVGLLVLSLLPSKVKVDYQLPSQLLKFSMRLFYQYIAVSEFVFHAVLLWKGVPALSNRILFFDHWTFKLQTAVFMLLLLFMLVVGILDFARHAFYRSCT